MAGLQPTWRGSPTGASRIRGPRPAWAVIVSAGESERFAGPLRKPYMMIGRHSLLWYSARVFASHPLIEGIVLVVHPADTDRAHEVLKAVGARGRARVVCGGARRQDSVRAGVRVLDSSVRWVLIHDAARPLVRRGDITAVLAKAKRSGAAILAAPVVETVKRDNGRGVILKTVPREGLWLAHTPQAFERRLLERAFATSGEGPLTDEAMLLERGHRVALVESSRWNVKVTTREDLAVVRAVLASGWRP